MLRGCIFFYYYELQQPNRTLTADQKEAQTRANAKDVARMMYIHENDHKSGFETITKFGY